MSNTKILKILMKEIENVEADTEMTHLSRSKCFNRLINVFQRTATNNLRATNIAIKMGDLKVPDISSKLKRPELK